MNPTTKNNKEKTIGKKTKNLNNNNNINNPKVTTTNNIIPTYTFSIYIY